MSRQGILGEVKTLILKEWEAPEGCGSLVCFVLFFSRKEIALGCDHNGGEEWMVIQEYGAWRFCTPVNRLLELFRRH